MQAFATTPDDVALELGPPVPDLHLHCPACTEIAGTITSREPEALARPDGARAEALVCGGCGTRLAVLEIVARVEAPAPVLPRLESGGLCPVLGAGTSPGALAWHVEWWPEGERLRVRHVAGPLRVGVAGSMHVLRRFGAFPSTGAPLCRNRKTNITIQDLEWFAALMYPAGARPDCLPKRTTPMATERRALTANRHTHERGATIVEVCVCVVLVTVGIVSALQLSIVGTLVGERARVSIDCSIAARELVERLEPTARGGALHPEPPVDGFSDRVAVDADGRLTTLDDGQQAPAGATIVERQWSVRDEGGAFVVAVSASSAHALAPAPFVVSRLGER
jgi:Flp pilus assembly pilin Flp